MKIKRRDFMRLLDGAAVTWPLAARAQQTTLPVIGYLSSRSPSDSAHIVAAFRQGLQEAGFVEGQNVTIESRFAEGHFDRLPALADDLVRRQVNVLVATGGTVSVVKAKPVVPATIPIVFAMGGDPVKLGVVASLARTGGNITGVSFLVNELAAKSVELLHELVPKATVIGFLVNPNDPNAESDTRGAQTAADAFGLKLVVAKASTASAIESAFTTFVQQQVAALFVDTEPFFTDQRANIVALAARHALPAVYQLREFAAAGGLITYGTSITDANRQLGVYTGRVLKGTNPADLPVMQSMKFELIINLKTAKALGLTIPPHLLMLADEVIQ
jgi:putative tryptophan/tyrosine transport system substrate-binding protein